MGEGSDGGLSRKLAQVKKLQDQIIWLSSTYRFYGGFADSKLETVRSLAKNDFDSIRSQMVAYVADPTQQFPRLDVTSLKEGTPALSYEVGIGDAFGVVKDSPFDDVDRRTYIQKHTRVSYIQFRWGDHIDKMIVGYEQEGRSWEVTHGGKGGDRDSPRLQLLAGQFVTKVSGRWGSHFDHVTITISGGSTVEGGGSGGSTKLDWSVPEGKFALGFSGYQGGELWQLRVVYANFRPATWEKSEA